MSEAAKFSSANSAEPELPHPQTEEDGSADGVPVVPKFGGNTLTNIGEEHHEEPKVDIFVMHCFIGLACIVGSLIRLGFSFFTIWRIETSVNYRYYNFLGSLLMGFFLRHRPLVYERSDGQFFRYFYVALTTGLCGSITSFSTMQAECNKSFFLQWDSTWGNHFASYNGGKFLEWLMCMFGGIAEPLVAFHAGQHAAAGLSPLLQWRRMDPPRPAVASMVLKGTCAAMFVVLLVIVSCGIANPRRLYLIFDSLFAVAGGFLRFRLTHFNNIYRDFPVGTFVANVFGSWVFASFLLVSKHGVDYYDVVDQAVLHGVLSGFCGCLTTISTFVKELAELPSPAVYKYAFISSLVAQAGFIFLYNIYSYTTIPLSAVVPAEIDICFRQHQICAEFLQKANCSLEYIVNSPCSNDDYNTYGSDTCRCKDFRSNHFSELLVDSQVAHNVLPYSTAVWPREPHEFGDASQTYDVCLTHSSICSLYLDRIACPSSMRAKDSCGEGGIGAGVWQCSCGPHDTPGGRILELISDTFLSDRYDLIPYAGYATTETIDFESAFVETCTNILDHVNCPQHQRSVQGNGAAGDYGTWIGRCECGHRYNVNSVKVAETLFDVVMRPAVQALLVKSHDSLMMVWDACASYENICSTWLDRMDCPADLRQVGSCDSTDPVLNGTLMAFNGKCVCGAMAVLSDRSMECVIDSLVAETVRTEFLYIQQPHAVYSTVMSSSAFKQLQG